jgi:small-conductance mechanosensitive channel
MPHTSLAWALPPQLSSALAEHSWIVPLFWLLLGLLVGIAAEKFVSVYLYKLAKRTPWEADDILIRSLRGMPFIWLVLGGAYFALDSADLPLKWQTLCSKTLLVLFLTTLTLTIARMASAMVVLYSVKTPGLLPSTSIFRNLTTLAVILCGALVILDTLGISIAPILTALGVGGLAVALALQDTLSNLFAGIQILASRQVRIGDYIKLASGEEGYVTDIRWRNTTVRALPNNLILIPNSKLASAITTNYYMPDTSLSVSVEVGVAYDSDLERVEAVTIEVARDVMKTVRGGVPEHEPSIRYHTFADSSINFSVNLRGVEFADQYLIKHEFIKRLQRRYAAENINIPFPIRTVYMQTESENAAPDLPSGDEVTAPSGSSR